ncbi:MAG: hypothetical protein KF761_14460 [Salinibacterium sp.]|nr:hypothetical protein [Salinibacterium sp.]
MALIALNLGRPIWQIDPCPPWCEATHSSDDHPDDRVHRSEGITISTTTRRRHIDGDHLGSIEEEVDLEVGIARADGDTATWLYIGAGPASSVEVQLEAADEIVAAILRLSGS